MYCRINQLSLLGILLFLFTLPQLATSAVQSVPVAISQEASQPFTRANLEKQLGRKMTFKEKVGFCLFKKKIQKMYALHPKVQATGREGYGMAVTSFVLGVLNLPILFFISIILGFLLAVLSVVFAAIALRRIRRVSETHKGEGLATAGLVLGIVGLAVFTVAFLIILDQA